MSKASIYPCPNKALKIISQNHLKSLILHLLQNQEQDAAGFSNLIF